MPPSDLYKSRHAGLAVKVRSALTTRHPVTGDIIGERPAVWANFGEAMGEVPYLNPLTGEMDIAETFRGGTFSIAAAAEEQNWDEDICDMVRRRLDKLCIDRPAMCQRVDYVVEPAPKPWPTYDDMTDINLIAERAKELGLVGKAAAYERENQDRTALVALLEGTLQVTPDPEPEPAPVVAAPAKKTAGEPTLDRVQVI